jgi:hypothetical protein
MFDVVRAIIGAGPLTMQVVDGLLAQHSLVHGSVDEFDGEVTGDVGHFIGHLLVPRPLRKPKSSAEVRLRIQVSLLAQLSDPSFNLSPIISIRL